MQNPGSSLQVICQVLLSTYVYRHDIEFGLCDLSSCEGADGTIRIIKKHQARMFDRGREHVIEIDFLKVLGLSWVYPELIAAPKAVDTANKKIAADDGGNDNYEFHELNIWSVLIQRVFVGVTIPCIADLMSRLFRSSRTTRFLQRRRFHPIRSMSCLAKMGPGSREIREYTASGIPISAR